MTREELFGLHGATCAKALDLMKKKNADYSKEDPFGNFYVCEVLQICSAAEGIIVRLSDKLSRLVSVMAKGSQVDESVEDTCIDVINYTVLMLGVLKNNKVSS